MTTNTLLSSSFLRIASFFDASDCIAVKATCRRAKPIFWENEKWWKEVITPIQEIERQFGACLEPETRHLLRRRTVFNPATEKFVQERVSQLRTVCDQLKQDQLPPYDTALVLRHAVTMTSYGRHLPVHPVLAS